ncbi:MAG TPA: twin-arginine translocase TatA/TatE family subunit [Actinomycetota bacterium]|nr:twin-arginine translocase TatA/TatE family subunit [Actinomycetota bacterium]
MLNVGPLELLVVLAVALIVVGPERLPELARSVGRALRQLRQVQDEVRDMVAMGVDDDVRKAASDFKRATGEISKAADVRGAARKAGRTARDEARRTLEPRTPGAGEGGATTDPVRADGPVRDGPAAPDAPTGPDGASWSPPAEAEPAGPPAEEEPAGPPADAEPAGPPADRLVEDPGAVGPSDDRPEGS